MGANLLVHIKLAEDLGRVEEVLTIVDPRTVSLVSSPAKYPDTYFFALNASRGKFSMMASQ